VTDRPVTRGIDPAQIKFTQVLVMAASLATIATLQAWPALVMAALANTPLGGAAIMAAFALGTTLGLWVGPTLWWRVGAPGGGWLARGGAVRLAGLMLAGVSAWALSHDLGARIVAYCLG